MANTHSLDLELNSSQYVWCVDNADISVTGDITIEMWIKVESAGAGAGHLFNKNEFASSKASYGCYVDPSRKLAISFSDDGTTANTHYIAFKTDSAVITFGQWYHVAFTFDISSETCIFYVDGTPKANSLIAGSTIGASIHDNDSRLSIGARRLDGTPFEFYDGLIDEIRLWDDVRTEQEINDNKGTELIGNETNLVGYWKFNNDYTDSSKSSDLTAVGSPVFSEDVPTWVTNYTLTADVGAFTLTGIAVTFTKALTMSVTVGTFTLTGIAAILSRGITMVASVGAFILTGIDTILTLDKLWENRDKSTAISPTNLTKIDISPANIAKNNATFINQAKS